VRVQLVGIILSIVLCLAVREQQQQQQLLSEDAEKTDDADSASLDKSGSHKPAPDVEKPAE